ncbi:MAG TPA: ATP-binding protein [Longimicrobiaceae bacterium]
MKWFRKARPPAATESRHGPAERLIASLASRVDTPQRAGSVLARASAFPTLPPVERVRELAPLYLLFEHYLAEADAKPVARMDLRREVRRRFPELLELDAFRLILEPEPLQEILLCRFMLRQVLTRAAAVLGAAGGQSIAALLEWSERVPGTSDPAPAPGAEGPEEQAHDWVPRLARVAAALDRHIESILGERNATSLFEAGYRDTFESYSGLETLPVVIGLLPERLLDEQKIVLLSRRQVQRVVLDQVEKLQHANERLSEQNDELERMRQALQEAKRELEKRVVERTAALHTTTASLHSETVERQRAEEALDRVREQQEALLHSIPDPAWLKDSDRRFLAVNEATVRLLNADVSIRADALPLTRESLIGRRLTDLLEPAAAERVAFHDAVVLTEGQTLRQETVGTHRDGATRWLETVTMPARDRHGAIVGLVGVARDVTERKQLEARLFQSQKMEAVGRLAGGIAHDFNNVLTAIRGHAEFLLMDLPADTEARQDAEGIGQAVDRAAGLTRQLLAFSRKQLLQPRVIELNEVVTEMERMLRRLIGEDIELLNHPGPDLGRVRADPGQIEQVILNLAVNARDAMPDGGTLLIETQNVELDSAYGRGHPQVAPGSYVLLAISDTGCGMDEATQAQIFEPFFTTKEVGRGTGLGLATAYGIVQQSGGTIWVYSEVGKGTSFKIYLPRVDAPQEAKTVVPARPAEGGAETLLLVEDDPAVRALAMRLLERAGYTVIEASDGAEALRIAAAHAGVIDLLLTDAVMPRLGGRELAERLLDRRPGMAVLCMSGYTDDAVLRHGIINEGAAFLEKPFTPEGLLRKVRAVLDGAEPVPLPLPVPPG